MSSAAFTLLFPSGVCEMRLSQLVCLHHRHLSASKKSQNLFLNKTASCCVALFVIVGVIIQFSTNNGVQWQFLRELDFSSFLEPQVVTIELPSAAKTPYTVFRWWQPQQG